YRQRQTRAAALEDPREPGLVEDRAGEAGEVGRARVVALVDEAARRREVRARQAERARLLAHPRDEALDRAADALGEGDRGVVARRQQQAVEHRLELDPLAALQQPDD